MNIVYTKHALEKFILLKSFGWKISKKKVESTVVKPEWLGKTKLGECAAMSALSKHHILRVIYVIIDRDVKVITFHPAKKGRYETEIQ